MSHKVGEELLKAKILTIPFEVIAGGRQVSSFLVDSGDERGVYNLVENERDIGPVELRKVALSDEQIQEWLKGLEGRYETISPTEVRVSERSFRYEGEVETAVHSIQITSGDSQVLYMSRNGAAYPYTLVLHESGDPE